MHKVISGWFSEYFSDEEAVVLFFALLISFGVIYWLGEMLAPVFTALILAYMAQGLISMLIRNGLPEKVAVYGVFVFGVGLFVMVILMLLPLTQLEAILFILTVPFGNLLMIFFSIVEKSVLEKHPESLLM